MNPKTSSWRNILSSKNDVKKLSYMHTPQSVFSGRSIEKLLHDSIRMMWLAQIKHLLIKLLIVLE